MNSALYACSVHKSGQPFEYTTADARPAHRLTSRGRGGTRIHLHCLSFRTHAGSFPQRENLTVRLYNGCAEYHYKCEVCLTDTSAMIMCGNTVGVGLWDERAHSRGNKSLELVAGVERDDRIATADVFLVCGQGQQ